MSRPIKLTPDLLSKLATEFVEAASKIRMFDGKIDFSQTYTWEDDEKATVIFDPVAYTKMMRLIDMFSDEVAWHGTVVREDEKVFRITDILVYPQVVTGATVNTDQEAYTEWLYALPDEQFNAVRMQGHSHVNMGVTPSSTDCTHQESILAQLGDEDYYIFMIWNKKGDRTIKIYDLANNTLYETADVSVKIGDFDGEAEFEAQAKELVVKKTTTYSGGYGGGYYGGYNGYNGYGGSQSKITPVDSKSKETDKDKGKDKDKSKDKKNKSDTSKAGVGNGWKGRGLSALADEGYDWYDEGDYYIGR